MRAPAAATGDGRPRVVPRLGCRLPPRGEAAAAEAAAVAATVAAASRQVADFGAFVWTISNFSKAIV